MIKFHDPSSGLRSISGGFVSEEERIFIEETMADWKARFEGLTGEQITQLQAEENFKQLGDMLDGVVAKREFADAIEKRIGRRVEFQ